MTDTDLYDEASSFSYRIGDGEYAAMTKAELEGIVVDYMTQAKGTAAWD